MAQLIKIGKVWYSDLRIRCDGSDCKTPGRPHPHSHRRRKPLSIYKEVAEDKLADMVKARYAGRHRHAIVDPSWHAFKLKFLPYSKTKNEQTHYRDMIAIRYLEEHCEFRQLKDITPALLDHLKNKLKSIGKNDWNINRILSAIKAMMRKAQLWKMVEPQDWREVKMFKTPKGRLLFWTEGEVKDLFAECRGIWMTIAYLAVGAGLRRGEIRALPRSAVDFERKRIHIVANDEWVPKDKERRWVPMKPELQAYLETWMKKLPKDSRYALGDDRPNLDVMTNYFKRLVKKAKLKGSLHTGRHTYGAQLAMKGIPLAVIRDRMGHASVKTTEIYAHLCPETMSDKYAA